MAVPTATEIRDFLEGYEVTEDILSDTWIETRRDRMVVPWIERVIRRPVEGIETVTEYVSGTGGHQIFLRRRNIKELVSLQYVAGGDYNYSIGLGGVVLLAEEGIVRSVTNISEGAQSSLFHRGKNNIKVVYTVGETTIPNELHEAIILLTSEMILGFIGARTGGGSISVEGYSRSFGSRGKYQDARNDFKRQAMSLLNKYITRTV